MCCVLCCVLCSGALVLGLNFSGEQVGLAVEDEPAVREHIGNITGGSMKFWRSVVATETELYIFAIEGDRGRGEVWADESADGDRYENVRLVLPDGTKHPLSDLEIRSDGTVLPLPDGDDGRDAGD